MADVNDAVEDVTTTGGRNYRKKKRRSCTLFECAQLLVALSVPVAISVYTVLQYNNDQSIARENRRQDLEIANQTRLNDLEIASRNRQVDLEIANQTRLNDLEIASRNRQVDLEIAADVRAKDIFLATDQQKENILIEYQNFLANLLAASYDLSNSKSPVLPVIRYKTLATLVYLDPVRKVFLIRSLYDNKLTYRYLDKTSPISLSSIDLTGLNFSSTMTWSYQCLALSGVILNNVSFAHIDLDRAVFAQSQLNYANFAHSTGISDKEMCGNKFDLKTDFSAAQMYRIIFTGASYVRADFFSSIIDEGNFDDFSCKSCDIRYTSLVRASFIRAFIHGDGSNFYQANMTGSYLYKARFHNVLFTEVNMTKANATQAEFHQCTFLRARLINSSLNQANVFQSNMADANLTNSDLTNANLTEVQFVSAMMRNVNMDRVVSIKCNFQGADLSGSNLRNGLFIENNFSNATITDEQLASAKSLQGSILPNGTIVPMN